MVGFTSIAAVLYLAATITILQFARLVLSFPTAPAPSNDIDITDPNVIQDGISSFPDVEIGSCQFTIPPVPHYRTYFYVGGEYVSSNGETLMKNQMYVEHLTPLFPSIPPRPYPLIFIHGKAMTGTNWLNTPDCRPGWADYFLSQGYEVYIIDQPTRGRSGWLPGDFSENTYSAELLSKRFTAVEKYRLWPQSVKHTQWPDAGVMDSPVFDAFYSATVQFLSNDTEAQVKMRRAGAALLDRIGPAVLVTHSQGGLYGWTIADARPNLVRGIYAIEPTGPAFAEAVFGNSTARVWGLTDIPIEYDPPVESAEELETEMEEKAQGADLVRCIFQKKGAVRRLVNLVDVPVAVLVSEASYHAVYDHCIAQFLEQAGVKSVDLVRLEVRGVRGNAHMMFLEKNSLEVAEVVNEWISKIR